MKHWVCLVGALLAGAAVTGCTSDGGGSPDKAAGGEVTALTAPEPRSFKVGDKADTGGNTITVVSLVTVRSEHFPPEGGMEYRGADVEACAGPGADGLSLDPYRFRLHMPDGTKIHPMVLWQDPPLNAAELEPGNCVRGWVTFEAPAGQPATIVYRGLGLEPVIEWMP